MNKTILLCALFFLGTAGIAHAQLIQRVCDGHMPCTYEQFKAGEIEWFNKADINHDGKVDKQEQALAWQNYAQDILPACKDFQNYTTLKLDHVPTDKNILKNFAQIDINGDDKIDQQEDQRITQQINQTCQLLSDPQIQKLQQMLKQMQQNSGKGAPSALSPAKP